MSMSVRGAVICSCSPHTRMSTSADRTLHCAPPPATLQNTPQVLRTFLMVTFHQAPLHSSAPQLRAAESDNLCAKNVAPSAAVHQSAIRRPGYDVTCAGHLHLLLYDT